MINDTPVRSSRRKNKFILTKFRVPYNVLVAEQGDYTTRIVTEILLFNTNKMLEFNMLMIYI